MKMKLVFFFILVLIPFSWQQKGSLNLNAKLGPEYQLDSSVYTKQGSKLIKKISSLVNTPSFIINNEDLPQNGDNIKYTETDTHVIYIVVLPSFPSYVKKEDVFVSQSPSGLTIEVKDSDLFANTAFFPDLTSETSSAVIRGKNYKVEVHFFQKMKVGAKGIVEITDNSEQLNFIQKHIAFLKLKKLEKFQKRSRETSFLQIKNGPISGPIMKGFINSNLNSPIKLLDNRSDQFLKAQPHFLQKNAIIEENYVYHPEPPHSFVIRFMISKRDLEPNIYQNKLNKFYIGSISTIPSTKKLEEIHKKFKIDFEREVKLNPNGEKVEIFSKPPPEDSHQGPISKNLEEMIKDINKRLDPNFDHPREKKEWVKKAEEDRLKREREDEEEKEEERTREGGEESPSKSSKPEGKMSKTGSTAQAQENKNNKDGSKTGQTENIEKSKGIGEGKTGNTKGMGSNDEQEKKIKGKNMSSDVKKEAEGRGSKEKGKEMSSDVKKEAEGRGSKEKGKEKKKENDKKMKNQKKMDEKEKETNKKAEGTQKETAAIMEKSMTMSKELEDGLKSADEAVPESSEEEYEYES